jgi:hypothetical protein
MAMSNNQIVGLVLVVLGALLLLGWLHIPFLGTIIGVILVVLGVLALVGSGPMRKNAVLGVVLVVLGVLILVPGLGIGYALASLVQTVVAILLIVVGILKLMDKM